MTHQKLLAVLFAVALPLSACSSSSGDSTSTTDTGTTPKDSGGGSDTGTTPSDTGTPTDTGSGTKDSTSSETAGGDDSACGAATSMNDCQACCRTNHDAAYKAFADALLKCACDAATAGSCGGTSGACAATVCATTPKSPDAACTTCLGDIQSAGCKDPLTAACTGSGPCAPFEGCISTQCAGKK